jgi:hypothetical protein
MQTYFQAAIAILAFLTGIACASHAQDLLPYTTYASFDEIVEGTAARYPALTRISNPGASGSRSYTGFFFYQALQFDDTGRYALGMKVRFEGREVEAGDRAEIGYIDLKDGHKWTKIGESAAWNWQQGCRLQWRPHSDEIIWNDRSDDGQQFVSRVHNFRTGAKRSLPRPIYDLSPDGASALTHDFERYDIFFHGDKNIDKIQDKEFAPAGTGVWKMSLDTGKAELLVSLKRIAEVIYPKRAPKTGFLYFFREGWNPSGTRFIAFVKAEGLNEGYSISADGQDVRHLYRGPSHHAWRDDEHIFDFGAHIPPGGEAPRDGYFLFKDDGSGQAKEMLWAPTASGGKWGWNGHGSYLPAQQGDWIVSDTYVDARGFQYLFLYHVPSKLFVPLARLKSTLAVDLNTDCCRVDTHPRFTRDGRLVCIDASIEDLGRQMYVIDVAYIVDHPPTAR